jgi:hypothetical protein
MNIPMLLWGPSMAEEYVYVVLGEKNRKVPFLLQYVTMVRIYNNGERCAKL